MAWGFTPIPMWLAMTSMFSVWGWLALGAWMLPFQAPSASQPQTENIEVIASHIGIGVNPSAMWALADRLAQPEGQWQPFRRPRLLGAQHLVFPDPLR